MKDAVANELINQSALRMDECTERITRCLNLLEEKDVWIAPNEHLNSVGNLVLHLCGNIRQYIISSLGGAEDKRERDLEFDVRGGFGTQELQTKLQETARQAVEIIRYLTAEELLRPRIVQGMPETGVGIIIHVTEHYSYHTGQITFLTKLFKNVDTGYYAGQDLNLKNDPKPKA